jgi:hypothetical protein
MKKTIALLYFWLLYFAAFSQENLTSTDGPSYFALSVGPSIPLQDFKSTDGKNANAGFAKNGRKKDILWGKELNNAHWGVTGLLRIHKNPIDEGELALMAKTVYPSFDYSISAKEWNVYTLMAGTYYRIPVSRKLTVMPKAMVGLAYIYSPEIFAVPYNNSVHVASSYMESSHTLTTSYLIGIGLKSNLFHRMVLISNVDILGAFPTFNDVKTTYGNGTTIFSTKSPTILSFNYGMGIGYKF